MQGRFSIVEAHLPGQGPEAVGILLEDPCTDRLHLRFRRDWEAFADEENAEVLSGLAQDLHKVAEELGADALLRYLETNLSNTVRVTERETIPVFDFTRALDKLYREHIPSRVMEYKTHLPLHSLRIAAGRFLDNEEIDLDEWIEVPPGIAVDANMFVGRIVGRSMEPDIPDGSLCIFRWKVGGSRVGRRVLAVDNHLTGDQAFAVKIYRSEKRATGEDSWEHERIWLESINPEFPPWDLERNPDRYAILAEFVRVLE